MTTSTTLNDLRPRTEKKKAVANDGIERTTVSFYKYVRIADPIAFKARLAEKWGEIGCLGRIYVAKEGINAQMNVPSKYWDRFDAFNRTVPELHGVPYKIAVEEGDASSFYKLSIKLRDKIVADGLDDDSFDVADTGAYLTAKEMNEYIDDPEAVVVDMRNAYESEIGHFEGAILPDVDTFREELQKTPELLRVHKNKKIALYCTGGIRCEKASAWMKHNGFTDVRHLKGGIIDYKHQVEREGLDNKFRGKNFVFDERLSESIGNEVIATCHLCNVTKCDNYHHCQFQPCHMLFIGCDDCLEKKKNYCSYKCLTLDKLPAGLKKKYAAWQGKHKPASFKKGRMHTKR